MGGNVYKEFFSCKNLKPHKFRRTFGAAMHVSVELLYSNYACWSCDFAFISPLNETAIQVLFLPFWCPIKCSLELWEIGHVVILEGSQMVGMSRKKDNRQNRDRQMEEPVLCQYSFLLLQRLKDSTTTQQWGRPTPSSVENNFSFTHSLGTR